MFFNKFFKKTLVYICNSTKSDCKKDIDDTVIFLNTEFHYSWKQVSAVYYSLGDIKSVKSRIKLHIKILVSDYIIIPEYNSVLITDNLFLYELKLAGIYRKEIRWHKNDIYSN